MESWPTENKVLYIFEDRSGHRIVRATRSANLAICSHCHHSFDLVIALPREQGEHDELHERRAYAWRRNEFNVGI